MSLMLLILFLSLIIFFVVLCKKFIKQDFFCKSIAELYNNFFTYKEQYKYMRINRSKTNELIKILLTHKKLLFCEKFLYKNKNFLLALSKTIDFKINSNKTKYRSKNNKILIDQISSVVANQVLISNSCNLFFIFKKLQKQYCLKQKEIKVFKILLGQKLIQLLYSIETEIQEISKTIIVASKCKRLKKFKKQILNDAQIYSIKKFNPNSTKILSNFNQNCSKNAENLFNELLLSELKIKIILTYLTSIFS